MMKGESIPAVQEALRSAYKPAFDLAWSVGDVTSLASRIKRGGAVPADKMRFWYERLVKRLEAASSVATDEVLLPLESVHDYPVEILRAIGLSAFEIALEEAHSEALGCVLAADISRIDDVPPTWQPDAVWPELPVSMIEESLEAFPRMLGDPDQRPNGQLLSLHVYKEFSRAVGGIKPPSGKAGRSYAATHMTEAADAWCLEKRRDGLSLRDILAEMRGEDFRSQFRGCGVGSPTSVQQAINRAERHESSAD